MTVLDGLRAKLATEKTVLTRILSTENGQAKVKTFAQSPAGRWLREVKQVRDDLNRYFDSVGWSDD